MRRRVLIILVLLVATTGSEPAERVSAPPERAYSAFSEDPARRFDFWIGRWDVNLRIQQDDLTFRDSVRADLQVYSILGGKAILELWDSEPIKGYSLRYYDPGKQKWILWLSWPGPNRSGVSSLEGGFRHGRGTFRSRRTDAQGHEVVQRYSFNDITPFSLRWDDLTSKDGGKTWAKNWIMEMTRTQVDPDWPIPLDGAPTFVDGSRCDEEAYRPFQALHGRWAGGGAELEAHRILDGCALLAFLEAGERREVLFLTWLSREGGWETGVLDADPGTGLRRYQGEEAWDDLRDGRGERLTYELQEGSLSYRRGKLVLRFERAPPGSAARRHPFSAVAIAAFRRAEVERPAAVPPGVRQLRGDEAAAGRIAVQPLAAGDGAPRPGAGAGAPAGEQTARQPADPCDQQEPEQEPEKSAEEHAGVLDSGTQVDCAESIGGARTSQSAPEPAASPPAVAAGVQPRSWSQAWAASIFSEDSTTWSTSPRRAASVSSIGSTLDPRVNARASSRSRVFLSR